MDMVQLQESNSSNDSTFENGEEMESNVDASEVEYNMVKDEYREMEDDKDSDDDEIALEEPAIFLVTNDQDCDLEDKLEILENTNTIIKIEENSDDDVPKNYSKCARILNNQVWNNSTNWIIKTTPKNIIEIRTLPILQKVHFAAFALTTIPKDIIFGPFHGSVVAEGTGEGIWKIKCGKLVNINDTNWMEYVNYAKDAASRNIDIFQNENCLYYRTCRQIEKGEKLLVFYGTDYTNLENNETYYRPAVEEKLLLTFACTYCCISFAWNGYLIEHKKSCPYHCVKYIKQFVLCVYCKLYMEKTEHDEYHLPYCAEKQKIKFLPLAVNSIIQRKQVETSQKYKYDCPKLDCEYKTNFWSELQKHNLEEHCKDVSARYTCEICNKQCKLKVYLQRHIKRTHKRDVYKCTKCNYLTCNQSKLVEHESTHSKSERPHECKDCDFRSKTMYTLKRHILRVHSSHVEKKYKCSKCTFETHFVENFKKHVSKHQVHEESEVHATNCSKNNLLIEADSNKEEYNLSA